MNSLYINTKDNKEIIVRLTVGDKSYERRSTASVAKAQATLPLIESLLGEAQLKPDQIDKVSVEKGPGSFTGLRVGVSIANALSFALGVKINGKTLGEIEKPDY